MWALEVRFVGSNQRSIGTARYASLDEAIAQVARLWPSRGLIVRVVAVPKGEVQ